MLVRRSRERLEMEIERFIVLEHDGMIIGCAALYPFVDEHAGELACLAVHTDYRGSARGDALLEGVEKAAHALKLNACSCSPRALRTGSSSAALKPPM